MTKYRCIVEVQTNGPQPPKFTSLLGRVLTAPLQMLTDQGIINAYKVDIELEKILNTFPRRKS